MPYYYMVLPFVVALIRDAKGGVLIGQHPNSPRKPYPLAWDLPGGKMEEGETPVQTICREIKEETSLFLVNPRLIGVFHHSKDAILPDCRSDCPSLGICYVADALGEIVATEQLNVHYATRRELYLMKDGMTPWTRYFLRELIDY